MKPSTTAKYIMRGGTVLLLLLGQIGLKGVDALCKDPSGAVDIPALSVFSGDTTQGKVNLGPCVSNCRNLEEVSEGVEGKVVMGTAVHPNTNETSTFYATNVTKASIFNLGFTKSEECSDEAHDEAMIVKVSEERLISTDRPGAKGWHLQRVSQLDDDELSTVLALADLITGADSNYTLVSYFYDLEKNLLACAHLKKHDEDMAAYYDELLNEVAAAGAAAENADVAAAEDAAAVKDTSSGSKNGLFMFASAIAAAGITVVLGNVLAL